MGISTHILDTTLGKPAVGVVATLFIQEGAKFRELARHATDNEGRIKPFIVDIPSVGNFRIVFETEGYFKSQKISAFFPTVTIDFHIASMGEHYHVPLLLNPFGYSTYRGS